MIKRKLSLPIEIAVNNTNHALSLLKRGIEAVPLFLLRGNWSFDSSKNNGVVCADIISLRNSEGRRASDNNCDRKIIRDFLTVKIGYISWYKIHP